MSKEKERAWFPAGLAGGGFTMRAGQMKYRFLIGQELD
jgi:hypothetical protein